jgi:hypothetical protein
MRPSRDKSTQNLAERWCWEAARRDDSRVARRLWRQHLVDGGYRWMKGPCWMTSSTFWTRGAGWRCWRRSTARPSSGRWPPCVQDVLLYGLKTPFGIEGMNALPALLFSDEARMPLVGFNAQQVRHGVCQRGATKQQRERLPGPICPDPLAQNIVKLNLRVLEAVFNGAIRALAKAGVFGLKVTGIADGTDLEWLDQHGITFVVPAKANMAATANARAQAAAGEDITVGRHVGASVEFF